MSSRNPIDPTGNGLLLCRSMTTDNENLTM
jgi:hypothetical protein